MGKTGRWFRGLLGGKKSAVSASDSKTSKEKKRWSFVRSFRDRDRSTDPPLPAAVDAGGDSHASHGEGSCVYGDSGPDPNKHAIAVAAATAAVAEAAVAAAQAAAAVVELTSSRRCAGAHVSWRRKEDWAAVKIQSAFRGYLARRALKALKGLVKLQALVRGHIVRKQAVETLRCMQALVRVQSLVRSQASGRANGSEIRSLSRSSHQPNLSRSPHQPHLGPATPEKSERGIGPTGTKHARPTNRKGNASRSSRMDAVDMQKDQNWLDRWMHKQSWDHYGTPGKAGAGDEWKSDKILEVDLGKPNFNSKRRNNNPPFSHSSATVPASPSRDSTAAQLLVPTPSAIEKHLPSPLISSDEVDGSIFNTAENSPQFYSASSRAASSRRGPFTPKSECSRSLYSGYSDCPNYMANTESSRAKIRSQSAPRQRPELERSSLTRRFSIHGSGDSRQVAGSRASMHGSSSLHAKFTSKAYPGSGRLDRLGMPIHEVVGHSGTNHNRY